MKHLVTGGCGFLGNLIARRLFAGGASVRVLDVWRDPTLPPGIEFICGDVRDPEVLRQAMGGITVVHHTAALVPLTKANRHFWDVNVNGSRRVAEAAVRAGVRAFVHMSSSAIFGAPKEVPITESSVPRPVEPYGRSKLAGELAVREVCQRAGLPLIIMRPRTILGPGRLGIFQILFDWIREGRNVYTIGSGNHLFQLVHADDLMEAYFALLRAGRAGVYHAGTDRYGTLREALENLIRHAKSSSRVRPLPAAMAIMVLRGLDMVGMSPLAPWHYLTYHKAFYFDLTRLTQMGWRPRYSNDEMLREAYDDYCLRRAAGEEARSRSPHRRAVSEKLLWLVRRLS